MILPEEVSTVSNTTDADVEPTRVIDIRALDDKNVYIELEDRTVLVGRLTCNSTTFEVGSSGKQHDYASVHSSREV